MFLSLLFESSFYGATSYSYEIANISFVLPSSFDGPTYDLHDIFLVEFSNIPNLPIAL